MTSLVGMIAVGRTPFRLIPVLAFVIQFLALNLEAAQPGKPKAEVPGPAAPAFSVAGGVFTNAVTVELKAGDALVRFTTDGSEPGMKSPIYQNPIRVTGCTLLRAKAWHRDGTISRCVSQDYL